MSTNTANEKINFLITNLKAVKTDSTLLIPLLVDLEFIKNNPQWDDTAKQAALHEKVMLAYGKEYIRTRKPVMLGTGSDYSTLTKAFHETLLDPKLDQIFQGTPKKDAKDTDKHKDTLIFSSNTSAAERKALVNAYFTEAMSTSFINPHGEQIYANSVKAVLRLGDEAVADWNNLVTQTAGKKFPEALRIPNDKDMQGEKKLKTRFQELNANTAFTQTTKDLYWPLVLTHLLHGIEVGNITQDLQKETQTFQQNPANFNPAKIHAIVTRAYLDCYLTNQVKGIENAITEFNKKTGSMFLGGGKATYKSVAGSVTAPEEREALVGEAFKRSTEIFIDLTDFTGKKPIIVHSELFMQALGHEAIKSWNKLAATLDNAGEQYPNLLMQRSGNNEATIKSRVDSLVEEDANDLKTVMFVRAGMGIIGSKAPAQAGTTFFHAPPPLSSAKSAAPLLPSEKATADAASKSKSVPLPPDAPPFLSSIEGNKRRQS